MRRATAHGMWNLENGKDLDRDPAPEPLLAPPPGHRWEVRWSSEDPQYGGTGTQPLTAAGNPHFHGHAAVLLSPVPHEEEQEIPP